MTRDSLDDGAITTPEDFEQVLTAAVQQARDSGLDVRGVWEFETKGSTQRWEVEVVELATDEEE